jgi:osmotically-inducible protein OsmY
LNWFALNRLTTSTGKQAWPFRHSRVISTKENKKMSLQDETSDGLEAAQVMRAAQRRLEASTYAALKRVRCRFRQGKLQLNGRVPTYFHKQLAQEALRTLPGVTKLVNNISVSRDAWPIRSRRTK